MADVLSVLRSLFTGRDNVTHDLGRWAWAGSWLAVIALAAWHCHKGTPPSVGELAAALVVVAAGHGAALFVKQQTEPPKDPS